jgi:hypothetical protein
MRTLMIAVRRNYAWLLAAIGGAVARSMFRDVEKRGQTEHVHGMEFVGRSPEEVHLLIQAWNLLSVAPQAARVVGCVGYLIHRWILRRLAQGGIAIHGPHAGGPHQYWHLQFMLRTGASVTRRLRIPLSW